MKIWTRSGQGGTTQGDGSGCASSCARREDHEQVIRFSEALSRVRGVDDAAQLVLEEVRATFGGLRAELWIDSDLRRLHQWSARRDEVLPGDAPLAAKLWSFLREDAHLLTKPQDGPLAGHLDEIVREEEVSTGMALRLRGVRRTVGVLVVADPADGSVYDAENLRHLQLLGVRAGLALDKELQVEELNASADEREQRAMHDDVTGLPNRRLFGLQVASTLEEQGAGLLMLDLQGFGRINQTLGYQIGDRLLRLVAERIQDVVGPSPVARVGADEYAVLLPGANLLAARACAARVQAGLARSVDLAGVPVAMQASIGVAVAELGDDPHDALRRVELATWSARDQGTGVETYRPGLDHDGDARLALLADLHHAIQARQITLSYLPKFSMATGAVEGVEALARWHHPTLGEVRPDEFVPLAEESSLIMPLTELVLRQALEDVKVWLHQDPELTVAVNISPRSLLDPSFADEVALILASVDVAPSSLILEISEQDLLTDPENAIVALERLRAIGVFLSVDDLGTGGCSLAYLRRLPVDEVKIDRSFLQAFPEPQAQAVIETIIELAHKLDRSVVAEGVESGEAVYRLEDLGCDTVQGFWLARPMAAENVADLLVTRIPADAAADLTVAL